MARFLSQEWAARYNEALDGEDPLPAPGPDAGLTAAEGRFTLAEEVHGTPDGDVLLLVAADGGTLRFLVEPLGTGPADPGPTGPVADVTIVVSYEDAAAMAKGELTPAEALKDGRIRVRGDLSVLVAGQALMESARHRVEGLSSGITY